MILASDQEAVLHGRRPVCPGLAALGSESLLPLTRVILPYSEGSVAELTALEVWKLSTQREGIKKEYLTWCQKAGIDYLLCHAYGTVVPRSSTIRYWGYTSAFNLFDLPFVVLLLTHHQQNRTETVREAEYEKQETPYNRLNEIDCDNQCEYQSHRGVCDNAPVGLQLVGPRFEKEELLHVAEDIYDVLKYSAL